MTGDSEVTCQGSHLRPWAKETPSKVQGAICRLQRITSSCIRWAEAEGNDLSGRPAPHESQGRSPPGLLKKVLLILFVVSSDLRLMVLRALNSRGPTLTEWVCVVLNYPR